MMMVTSGTILFVPLGFSCVAAGSVKLYHHQQLLLQLPFYAV
jgi:hypothetical protein